MTGQVDPSANVLGDSPYAADPRMDHRVAMPPGQHSSLGDGAFLSPETQLDTLLQEMQAAQKREPMMKLAAMVQGMGQTPPPPGMPPVTAVALRVPRGVACVALHSIAAVG